MESLKFGVGPEKDSREVLLQKKRSLRFKVGGIFQGVLLVIAAGVLSTLLRVSLVSLHRGTQSQPASASSEALEDPSSGWKDDIWPIREQTPWDILTDYPFPRKLEYDVTEGTWLRLDVHPQTGEIVFDMLGDLYCLPAHAYSPSQLASGDISVARRVLLGVPHDSDPHFSPDGQKLVFRSDAELGVENIWVIPWTGCEIMDVRRDDASSQLAAALQVQHHEEGLLASGVKESAQRKHNRLLSEGRLAAQRVTNETYRWVSDARFHPSGSSVIATKWYTSSRSLGAGEGWQYSIPNPGTPVEVGSGKRVIGRTLPQGWGPDRYGDQQIGPEQFIWRGNDTLIYSKNVRDTNGVFSYSKDVHSGIYAIFSTNVTSKRTTTLVEAFPGGATRPELSRDGRTLAFVRRVRDKEVLVLKYVCFASPVTCSDHPSEHLETGTLQYVWDGLVYDLGAISAPMGAYPSFAFTADDGVVIWAAGRMYHVPLSTNTRGDAFLRTLHRALREVARGDSNRAPRYLSCGDGRHAAGVCVPGTAYRRRGNASVVPSSRHDVRAASRRGAPRAEKVPTLHPSSPYY